MVPKIQCESTNINSLIKESEDRFRLMADNAPVAIWMSNKESLCDFFNQGWLKFTGRTMEQELGLGWSEGVHPEDFQKCMDTYIEAFSERKKFTMLYRQLRHDGEYRWILDNGVPRFTENNEFMGYIGSCVDITEEILAKEKLDKMIQELEKALQLRDDFLSIASHEFRTPLTPLILNLQMLKRIFLKTTETNSYSLLIQKKIDDSILQADRLLKLIENMLNVKSMSLGPIQLNKENFDFVKLCNEIIEKYKKQIEIEKYLITVKSPELIMVYMDKSRMEEVINNLLNNALKYGFGKPIEITISINMNNLKFEIKDHGIGFSKSNKGKLFKRFGRVVSLENYGGFGLGLFVVKQIVIAHGGKVSVQSEVGTGSKFTLIIPL